MKKFMMIWFGELISSIGSGMTAFADVKALGIMESVSAAGMLVGSIIIGVLNVKRNYTKILMISLMTAGIFMALTGTTTNPIMIVVFCILFFTSLPFVNTCAEVLIRIRIPNGVQGRAWGMIGVLTQSGFILAYAICGVLADYVFEPMFMEDGILAGSAGRLIGTGEGRGVGFMLMIAGMMMVILAMMIGSKKKYKRDEGVNR